MSEIAPAPSRIQAPLPEALPKPPVKEAPLNFTGEEVKIQIDTKWDSLADPDQGLLWKEQPATPRPERDLLLRNLRGFNTTQDPELKANGKYYVQVVENGKVKYLEQSSSELIDQVLEEAKQFPDNPEIQEAAKFLRERAVVHGIEDEQAPISYDEWEKRGKPKGEPRFKAEGSKPAETQPNQTSSEVKSPETAQKRETLLKKLKDKMNILYYAKKGKLDWEFSMIPSENKRLNDQNPELVLKAMKQAHPGIDFENLDNSEQALLLNHYRQLERDKMGLRKYGKGTPEELAVAARLEAEQQGVAGFLGNPDTIDVANVAKEFEEGGVLESSAHWARYQKIKQEVEQQLVGFTEQVEAGEKNLLGTIKLPNGSEIDITKSGLKTFGSNLALIAGLSAFLLYLEGDKTAQGQGGGMMGH